jgi:hypothetical protein
MEGWKDGTKMGRNPLKNIDSRPGIFARRPLLAEQDQARRRHQGGLTRSSGRGPASSLPFVPKNVRPGRAARVGRSGENGT